MNFIFISPNFPNHFWKYCEALRRNDVTVLAIGDCGYELLDERLKQTLSEYYRVDSLENYDQVFKAVSYFSFHYGKIDWIESQNEYWLYQDARLRTDFNVKTGIQIDAVETFKSKFSQKYYYKLARIPCAPCVRIDSHASALRFAKEVGYPVFIKREIGTGATDTFKIYDEAELKLFLYKHKSDSLYEFLIEKYIEGDIYSYDAILNSTFDPLFECSSVWPSSIANIVKGESDMTYYTMPTIDPKLLEYGHAAVRAFGISRRFVHLEFFRLRQNYPNLGKKGDFVGMEVNLRPAGGYATDMMCWGFNTDVYKIWADMVTKDSTDIKVDDSHHYCVYASRRNSCSYRRSFSEIEQKFGTKIKTSSPVIQGIRRQMGDWMTIAQFDSEKDALSFASYVEERTIVS